MRTAWSIEMRLDLVALGPSGTAILGLHLSKNRMIEKELDGEAPPK